MKKRIYIRVAKHNTGFMVKADKKPKREPLRASDYAEYRPTVLIALDLDIPDKEFDAARILLEAKIQETIPAVDIGQVGIDQEEPKEEEIDMIEPKEPISSMKVLEPSGTQAENGEGDQGSQETD